ncbi:MAG: hypothetical protein LAP87_13665 [Acidobacteriia bacterium]|nr:hypothetical protein [Terriglobia bacterium]
MVFGFEQPAFTVGNINGQQGWSKSGNYDAVVSNGAALGGDQSLRISSGITSGSFGDQTFTQHLATPAGESSIAGALDTFEASWSFKSATGGLQDGLFISVSADNGAGARMTWVGMGDDAVNGLNLGFYDWSLDGGFQYQQVATHLDYATWHSVDLTVSFLDGPGNDVVKLVLDGTTVATGTTWEDFYRFGPTSDGGGGGLSPVNSLLFRAGGAAAPATLDHGFYIDNVSLASQTPEPGTAALAVGALLVVGSLRRRKRA